MSDLRVGLVGCGRWGRNILRDLKALNIDVFVVDPALEARSFAEGFDVPCFLNVKDLPQVDGMIVATPASTHADVVDICLEQKVPIFVEKPFTLDIASAEKLARTAPDLLFVMHVWRYHPGVEALRDIVQTGTYGPVEWIQSVRANWTSPRKDVDSVWTLLPHDVSMVLEVLGDLPEPISAFAEWHQDAAGQKRPAGIVAVLGNDPRVILETSTRYGDKRREFRVHCRDAVLDLTGTDTNCITVCNVDEAISASAVQHKIAISDRPALMRELEAFLAHLRGGPPPRSRMADALKITRAVVNLRELAGISV